MAAVVADGNAGLANFAGFGGVGAADGPGNVFGEITADDAADVVGAEDGGVYTSYSRVKVIKRAGVAGDDRSLVGLRDRFARFIVQLAFDSRLAPASGSAKISAMWRTRLWARDCLD